MPKVRDVTENCPPDEAVVYAHEADAAIGGVAMPGTSPTKPSSTRTKPTST
jgi:hypothetical protein